MCAFLKKYREIFSYLVVGGLTTVIGFGTYFLVLFFARAIGIGEEGSAYNAVRVIAQILQWILAVLFAYVANKNWVFRYTEDATKKQTALNFFSFVASRLFSLGADSAVTFGVIWLLVSGGYVTKEMHLIVPLSLSADFWGKISAALVVIVLNYVLGKFLVFRKAGKQKS